MKKTVVFLFFLLAFCSVSAWDEFNQYSIADELKKPGVKLVAVDFYATWCVPCNEAIPKWKKLQEKYGDKGFKLIVVSVQSEGSCSQPPQWNPDKIVCDYDGDIAEAWHASNLPQAFLWSWQGNLLVAHGGVDNVAAAIEQYFKKIPRVYVEEGNDKNIYKMVRSELIKNSKIEIVASDKERKALVELRKKSSHMNYDAKLQCKLGEEVSANSRLVISKQKHGKKDSLVLELFSVEKGCLTASGTAQMRGNMETEVAEAVYNLLKNLLGTVSMPNKETKTAKTDKPKSNDEAADKRACEYAKNENSLETWEDYLAQFPNGECSFEAKSTIKKLQKQSEAKEKIKLSLHIMSKCNYGNTVLNNVKPVLDKLGNAVDFELNYIGYEKEGRWMPMHGAAERQGDKIALCAKKHLPKNYMNLLVCMSRDFENIPDNFENCIDELELDAAELKNCIDNSEGEDLLIKSYKFSRAKKANGSPTIFIANKSYKGGRSTNDFMRTICDEYKTAKPKVCNSIPKPTKVKVTIISDKRCKECKQEDLLDRLKGMFPGLVPEIIDYSSQKGKQLYKKFVKAGFVNLPIVAFESTVQKDEKYQTIVRWTEKVDKYILLRIGAKFDPTKEICDNGIDDTNNGTIDCDDNDCKEDMACRVEIPRRIDLFVMSQCPYGIKALNSMKEVFKVFGKDKLDLHVNYIANETEHGEFQALHGQGEVDENIRELCAAKHYPKDYMNYIWCRNENIKENDWQKCAKGKIKASVIEKCSNDGEGVKLHSENIKIGNALNIGGSPTWIFNNKYMEGGIDVETIIKHICSHNKDFKGCKD